VEFAGVVDAAITSVRPAAEAKGLRIECRVARLQPIIGDPGRLQQVVWNLVSNATKFAPPGGHIEVTLERQEQEIVLRVSDSGIGIDPHFLPHVFERFRQADSTSTRAHGGLGLGLAIVRHLVELHGTVEAESPGIGKGATFTVRMPMRIAGRPGDDRAQGTAPAVPVPAPTADLLGVTVLGSRRRTRRP
jgi:signal transduction histidine kinase